MQSTVLLILVVLLLQVVVPIWTSKTGSTKPEQRLEVAAFQVKRSVRSAICRCLRSIFRIYWPNCITNEELIRRAEIEPVEMRIRRQKWAWIGHTLRKNEDSIARMAMEWNPFQGLGSAAGGQCQT